MRAYDALSLNAHGPLERFARAQSSQMPSASTKTRLVRKMRRYNPIPSKYGVWLDDGSYSRNFPIRRIAEDPVFKDSAASAFIQMADFCVHALLQKERPLPSKKKYMLHKAFECLKPICVLAAHPRDPFGIIR